MEQAEIIAVMPIYEFTHAQIKITDPIAELREEITAAVLALHISVRQIIDIAICVSISTGVMGTREENITEALPIDQSWLPVQ